MSKRRSMAEMLADMPTPEHKAVYMLERVDAIQRQIIDILGLVGPEARALVFAHNPRVDRLWHIDDVTERPKTRRRKS